MSQRGIDEQTPGDRTALCEVLYYIGRLADDEWLRSRWSADDVNSSYESMMSIIFDDFNLWHRAAMTPGYLETPVSLPSDLAEFARLLESFDATDAVRQRQNDAEILDLPNWGGITQAARSLLASVEAWRKQYCSTI